MNVLLLLLVLAQTPSEIETPGLARSVDGEIETPRVSPTLDGEAQLAQAVVATPPPAGGAAAASARLFAGVGF